MRQLGRWSHTDFTVVLAWICEKQAEQKPSSTGVQVDCLTENYPESIQ